MSKQTTKRKITVEVASKTSEQPKSRPSVFERLGTKTITTSSQSNANDYCRHWSQNGTCPYGKSCKYASTHTLTSPSKRAAKKDEQKKQNRTTTTTVALATGSGAKDEPNKRLHSTIVKALRSPEPAEWEQWNQTDLEDADAEMLEKRRQELQRELELQMKMESKQTKGKEKTTSAKKGSSSSSSNSSSSSTESSSSSEETSSTSSSTSLDSRSRKAKRTKAKRDSSSSTEPERRKKKPTSKSGHKHATSSTSNIKLTEKKKTSSPAMKHGTAAKAVKSPSPSARVNRRLSQTPPLKSSTGKMAASTKGANKPSPRSPRSQSQTQTDRSKEKHRTPSPKLSTACARDRDRERERDRERVKEKDRAREKEREKTREKERERERERERDKDKIREKEKSREREKGRERDREHNNAKSNSSRSPKRANSRQSRDISKKKDSPTDTRNKVPGEGLKSRSTNASNSNSGGTNSNTATGSSAKRDSSSAVNKSSPVTSSKEKEERRLDRNRDEDNNKKKDDRERRDRDRGDRDRDVKDRSLERRKDKDKDKEKEKEKDKEKRDDLSRDRRERERERRMTREEREAAREKEREEALARCQERQRERERLKELAKKERESIPSLLHINTGAATNVNRMRERDRDRDRDRGLDKPPADRVERLLPLPADRIPPMRKELERQAARSQDRTSNRSNDRPDRNRSTTRGGGGVREPNFDYRESRERDRERDRDFPALAARAPREERRHDEKNYESPYRRDERPPSYIGLEHEHYENPREREFPEERRGGRRDAWDARDIEPELVLDDERRRGYGREREEGRPSSTIKERAWDNPDYMNRAEWERNRRPEWSEDWEPAEHNSMEEEWRHYNRSMDSWPSDDRRRWPQEFPERRPGPTSTSSHREAEEHLEVALPVVEDAKKETLLGKRIAEPVEDIPEVKLKKVCVAIEDSTILEDALSEISDDADEILNREDEPIVEQSKEVPGEEVTKHGASAAAASTSMVDEPEVKPESPVHEYENKQQLQPQQEQEQDNLEEAPIDEDGIDNMDFEEISDEELEEEVKVKGLGDALGVDWASLVAECRPRSKPDKAGGAKKRWQYCNVLARIGVSLEMAGVQVVQDILADADANNTASIAAIQVAGHENTLVRNNLFASAGPYRRALSARRDLAIRRHLCNLPMFTFERPRPPPPDPLFYETVLNTITIK